MYWAGGCPSRVHRGNKTYPGAKRFMQPIVPKPPIDWREIISNIVGGTLFFGSVGLLIYVLLLVGG